MHIGKIARIPLTIREQLNRRLQNGEIGNSLLDWLNSLPEVQAILAQLFAANPITKQNLSEWRRRGYQDWLRHQTRQETIERIAQQGMELGEREHNEELFEAFARILMAEWGEAIESLRAVRNPNERIERLQKVTREFSRLQNGYNWSRHVALEWEKWKEDRDQQLPFQPSAPHLDPPTPQFAQLPKPGPERKNLHSQTPKPLDPEPHLNSSTPKLPTSPTVLTASPDQSGVEETTPTPSQPEAPQSEPAAANPDPNQSNPYAWSAVEPGGCRGNQPPAPAPVKPYSPHRLPTRGHRWHQVDG